MNNVGSMTESDTLDHLIGEESKTFGLHKKQKLSFKI